MLPALSHAALFLPADWIDLMLDGEGSSAEEHFHALARQVFAGAPEPVIAQVGQDLARWRLMLGELGVVSHGVVAAPEEGAAGAYWQVMSAVVEVPRTAEIDLEILRRLFANEMGEALHTEAFSTDMGIGFGFVATPTIGPPAGLAELGLTGSEPQRTIGLAVALSCAPGTGAGLVVVGMCLDASQVVTLAGLVAVIAGRSVLELTPDAVAAEPELRAATEPANHPPS